MRVVWNGQYTKLGDELELVPRRHYIACGIIDDRKIGIAIELVGFTREDGTFYRHKAAWFRTLDGKMPHLLRARPGTAAHQCFGNEKLFICALMPDNTVRCKMSGQNVRQPFGHLDEYPREQFEHLNP